MADNWFEALQELGIPTSTEPNEGLSAGGYFLPVDVHPTNQTRSDARRAYYDPNIARDNFNVQPNSQVTRVLLESSNGLHATGVEVRARNSQSVACRLAPVVESSAVFQFIGG